MIHHIRNNSSLQRFGALQTVFYCCERGLTCWQTREGAPGGLFCLVQFLILSHILCFRKKYRVLTLSRWNGNTGLSSHCIAWAQKCSDHHCLCYPSLCFVFPWFLNAFSSASPRLNWIIESQVSRFLNISPLLAPLLVDHPFARN